MKTLIVIDMQNDFLTGTLANPAAVDIIPNIVNKVTEYLQNGDKVIFTQDTHFSISYNKTIEGQKLPVDHCFFGTKGHELVDELKFYTNRYNQYNIDIIYKNGFGEINLHKYIPTDTESIEIVGTCTDICVISNAFVLKAAKPNTPIIIDAAACAGLTPELHDNALDMMEHCHMDIINRGKEPWRK